MPHKIPTDLKTVLEKNSKTLSVWNSLTPLAQNEWICWVISVKKEETRKDHLKRIIAELNQGKRRPCCWIGCIHRTDKTLSPSVSYIINKSK